MVYYAAQNDSYLWVPGCVCVCVTIQMNATEQYFPVVSFIMLYKEVLTFESVDDILKVWPFKWKLLSCIFLRYCLVKCTWWLLLSPWMKSLSVSSSSISNALVFCKTQFRGFCFKFGERKRLTGIENISVASSSSDLNSQSFSSSFSQHHSYSWLYSDNTLQPVFVFLSS